MSNCMRERECVCVYVRACVRTCVHVCSVCGGRWDQTSITSCRFKFITTGQIKLFTLMIDYRPTKLLFRSVVYIINVICSAKKCPS